MHASLPQYVALLRRVADDLERTARSGPSRAELQKAPVLMQWSLAQGGMPVLVGIVNGHPRLGPGPIRTSPVFHVSDDRTWARTLSRWYRLGTPASELLRSRN